MAIPCNISRVLFLFMTLSSIILADGGESNKTKTIRKSQPKFVQDICGDRVEGCEKFAKRGDCDGSQPENLNFTLYKKIGTARDMLNLCRTTCR